MSSPSPSVRSETNLVDLDVDSLTHIASFLNLRDVSNIAMSCKQLNRAAYSDSVWQLLFRREWQHVSPWCFGQVSSVREAYLCRLAYVNQFKFQDPMYRYLTAVGKPPHQMLFDKGFIVFSSGPLIQSFSIDHMENELSIQTLGSHKARVTCMRRFSESDINTYRDDNSILVTSSSDHSIRIWSKGGHRCLKGHNGPVSTISDKLVGDSHGKVFASGSEDCTVRLWSINSTGKRGQRALRATLHGHDKAVSLVSVAGHKTSLLVSISKNGKVRVWDTNAASYSGRSSCCVGTTSVTSTPIGMKCHESLLYVCSHSSVTAVDLRTMSKVFSVIKQTNIHSFGALPSKSTFCTGQHERVMMHDIRKVSNTLIAEPTMKLDGHVGPVNLLYMDSYKVVSAGPDDSLLRVWDVSSGSLTNSLPLALHPKVGCSALAVNGSRIAAAGGHGEDDDTFVFFADYNSAKLPLLVSSHEESSNISKFWGSVSDIDSSSDSEGGGEWS